MSFTARSASQAIRASRRVSGLAAKAGLRPTQTASYSLLAKAATVKAAQAPAVQVRVIRVPIFSNIYGRVGCAWYQDS
jgi:hypothetical protein